MDPNERRRTMKIDEKMSKELNRRSRMSLQEEAEIAAALKEVHQSTRDDEPLYYDKKVRRDTAKLLELSTMSRKTMFRRLTTVAKKQKKSVSLPMLKEEIESPEVVPVAKSEPPKEKKPHPWSREGLVALYETSLQVGKGHSRPPHIIPYRFLGTPDLKRDDSLLPKTFQFAKRIKLPDSEDDQDAVQRIEGEPMVLPLKLRAACWNGERWEGTSQTSSEAKRSNGFTALYSEVVKSQKRVILCKTGQYFLEGINAPPEEVQEQKEQEKRRASLVSEIPKRQHKRHPSSAKPFIPPLPLQKVPPFEQVEAREHNQEILSAYREESNRYATARLASPTDRTMQESKVLLSGRTISGLPLKACGETSLRQLGNILRTNTSFRAMQNHLKTRLTQSLRTIETTRPYHFAREFGMKHKGAWDSNGTPRRASTFRRHLVRFGWFEDLLDMTYTQGRFPTKSEIYIIEDIRRILDGGWMYTASSFTDLFLGLGRMKMDLESFYAQRALLHVQNALKVTDLELLTDLMLNKAKLPSWLESKTAIVKQAIRDLSPHRFPMSNWADSKSRKQTPLTKLRKLYWMKDKFASLRQSHKSLVGMGGELPSNCDPQNQKVVTTSTAQSL